MKKLRRKKWDRKGTPRHLRRAAIRDGMDPATAASYFPPQRTPVDVKAHNRWKEAKLQPKWECRHPKLRVSGPSRFERFVRKVTENATERAENLRKNFRPASLKPGQRRSRNVSR